MPKKSNTIDFIEKSKNIFNNLLYDKVNYINNNKNVILTCIYHGDFYIKPKDHLCYKRGCFYCSGSKKNTQIFIKKAKLIHKDKYDYSLVNYINAKQKVKIICNNHDNKFIFEQAPDKHINAKQGCPRCMFSSKKDLNYVIIMGNKVHNNFYDYSEINFIKMSQKIKIICPAHGPFYQTPTNHIINKQGCKICILRKSKKEKQWLNNLNVINDKFHRSVRIIIDNKYYIVDGFDPITKTVYEFYGDYWHGNPKIYNLNDVNKHSLIKFGELYNKTIERENLIKKAGYKIISIWENDFNILNKQKKEK